MYKYSCRKCPIRNRCIDESANSPTVKEIVRHAFAARTDTVETWGLLQPNCLLIKAEDERARTVPQESMLSRRLRQAREAREQAAKAMSASAKHQLDYLKPVSPSFPRKEPPDEGGPPDVIGVPDAAMEKPARDTPSPLEDRLAPEHISSRWMILPVSGRHISLPSDREIILGRFDPNFGIPPDIDLSFEDQQTLTVSRQHARITGSSGQHRIEDLGSRHGVFVNGEKLRPGPPHQLRLGDHIKLGDVQLLYEARPSHLLELSLAGGIGHSLTVTPTGRRLRIAPPNDLLIGRSDRFVDYAPDIDLSHEKDIAVRVSRRHAIITWRNGVPHVEDLGSGFGTRLNGRTLLLGQAVPLKPGDHIWLGGCVLAYDVEL